MEQAKIAAAKIYGLDLPYDQVPWFWSDQYGINLKIAGVFTGYENYVIRGNMDEEKFSVFYINNGRLIAVEAINDNKSFVIGKKLIKNQIIVPITALKDKESNLRSWLI